MLRPALFVLVCLGLLASGAACSGGSSPGPEPTPSDTLTITARALRFDAKRLVAVANAQVTVHMENRESGVPHNFAVYANRSAKDKIFVGEIFAGNDAKDFSFKTPAAGDYFFRCDVHPDTMTGTFAIR